MAHSMVDLQVKVSNLEKSNCKWIILFVSLINYCSSSSVFHCSFVVCRDGSCTGAESCLGATIGSVVGPSCTDSDGIFSCSSAEIGSVDLSCNGFASCFGAKLSGVDLINSCKAKVSCQTAKANGEIDELNDCCNEENQCQSIKDGLDIVNAGCVSYSYMCTFSACRSRRSQTTHFLSFKTYDSLMHQAKCPRVCPLSHLHPRVQVLPVLSRLIRHQSVKSPVKFPRLSLVKAASPRWYPLILLLQVLSQAQVQQRVARSTMRRPKPPRSIPETCQASQTCWRICQVVTCLLMRRKL